AYADQKGLFTVPPAQEQMNDPHKENTTHGPASIPHQTLEPREAQIYCPNIPKDRITVMPLRSEIEAINTENGLYVRALPTVESANIGSFMEHDTGTLLKQLPTYSQIRYWGPDGTQVEGWVLTCHLTSAG
ncbi:MAG: hypothetical protein AAF214_07740, partial [Pseudomonadota bacterium]